MYLDVIEHIMQFIHYKSFRAVMLVNHDFMLVGESIINRRNLSRTVDDMLWTAKYYTTLIRFPFERQFDQFEIKPPLWRLIKRKLFRCMARQMIAAHRFYVELLIRRNLVFESFHACQQLELVAKDGSGYMTLARCLDPLRSSYTYYQTRYVDYLWKAHASGNHEAFKTLAHRYKSSWSKLKRIENTRCLTEDESISLWRRIINCI